ncbi:hypothetical protein BN946_scf184569.g37 [Trametes cinnabarina]|uniref:BTB domain-containing protein n=1 Tax=Pycnoporus cinnabarinus TaxID=5643 RepID=A0A060SDZ3_PYCCI|nr:hypothetical protein BN946_scf184569.g37 [Trametes cinnabarina]
MTLQEAPNEVDAPVAPHRDSTFYSDHVVILVEDSLFKVPKRPFVEGAQVFKDMFSLPGYAETADGESDDKPLKLEGITKDGFRALLRVMFESYHQPPEVAKSVHELSTEEWVEVLKLATMWEYDKIRRIALANLTPRFEADRQSTRWLGYARRYEVREWLVPALCALARRPQAIQLDEVDDLGIETVVRMAEIREDHRMLNANTTGLRPYLAYDLVSVINRVFAEELLPSSK